MAGGLDLDAYLQRIGYRGPREPTLATLQALHRAHVEAIPFESLDPFSGRPVRLDPDSLQAKLVQARRGGYCFEQNGLFLRVLRALGFEVTPLAARVRWMLPAEADRTPLSHMLLKVDLPEGPYLVDVGFGGQSPSAPLRLELGAEQSTDHGVYRLVEVGPEFELQMRLPDRWAAMYRFTGEAQGERDYEVANWFTSTHPMSRFTGNLVASRVDGARRLNLLNRELTSHLPDGSIERRVIASPEELCRVLEQDFRIEADPAEIAALFARLPEPA